MSSASVSGTSSGGGTRLKALTFGARRPDRRGALRERGLVFSLLASAGLWWLVVEALGRAA